MTTLVILTGFYFYYPFWTPKAENYFEPVSQRELQKDEIGRFNYVYEN